MNLTEPHCGTDLGLLKTRADPNPDGTYAITGTKIFISSGEHDLAENIIHLVLAKIAGAPDNVKGISLFLVPKFLVDDAGSLGSRNGVSCGSIEHKMGIHGNSTCVMNYDGAKGWLVGEPEKGLAAMFIMMNAARLGVGFQGLAQARSPIRTLPLTRRIGARAGRSSPRTATPEPKPITSRPPRRPADAAGSAGMERGGRAWCCGARSRSISPAVPDEAERQQADDLLGLLTPVIKSYLTDKGFAARSKRSRCSAATATSANMAWNSSSATPASPRSTKAPTASRRWTWSVANCPATAAARSALSSNVAATWPMPRRRATRPASPRARARARRPPGGDHVACANGMADPNNAGAGAYAYQDLMGLVAFGWMWLKMAARGEQGDRRRLDRRLLPDQARPRGILRQARTLQVQARCARRSRRGRKR